MNKIKIPSILCAGIMVIAAGCFVSSLNIPSEYKTITAYAIACVTVYVLYATLGELRHDDWEDDL